MSRRFTEVETAKAWHVPIHVWDAYPEESRADMMAYEQETGRMRRYEDYLNRKEQEQANARRSERRGRGRK